jgi:deazaflavin-dependent oxidoreductase (nitroreductase family)
MLGDVSVEVTPRGTRGVSMPRMPGRLGQFFNDTIFRIFRNRRFMGAKVLMLTTVGAHSGQKRRTTLGYFGDPAEQNAWIIVGSAAGAAKHPAWIYNLAKHPDQVWVEIGDQKLKVTPQTLTGEEREAAWRRIVAQAPNYADYETKTDRVIPLVRLTPAP